MVAELLERLRAAEAAHRNLRSIPPSLAPELKAGLLDDVLPALELAAESEPRLAHVAWRLTVDAQYHAGRSDTAGYRESADAWAAYERLRSRIGSGGG